MAFVEAALTSAGLAAMDDDEVEWCMQRVGTVDLYAGILDLCGMEIERRRRKEGVGGVI